MRILFVSGGSVGHLAPLIAVERALKEFHPQAETLFLCSDRAEDTEYLRKEGVAFEVVPLPRRSLSMPWRLFKNFLKSRATLRRFRPDTVFSKGGAVSVPCCLAASMMRIPVVLHESDAVMGRANRMVARWAETVCAGMAGGSGFGLRASSTHGIPHPPQLIFTGNPVRPEITKGSRDEGLKITGLAGDRPVLLVMGGSQGAEALNAAVAHHIGELLTCCDVIHLTGKGKAGAEARKGYWSMEFAYGEMPHLYAAASFALSRAGAGFIGELAANGIPAILVPIRGLANDHQVKNAQTAEEQGGFALLPQEQLDDSLVSLVESWARDPQLLAEMSQKARFMHQPEAARRIAEILAKGIA